MTRPTVRLGARTLSGVALGAALLVGAAACSAGGDRGGVPAGPNPTSGNPGPNTAAADPGPNSTARGPDTVSGVLRIRAGCVQLRAVGPARSYELRLPSELTAGAAGLRQRARAVAAPGDEVFVAGRVTGRRGRCGTIVAVEQLVSVIPAQAAS